MIRGMGVSYPFAKPLKSRHKINAQARHLLKNNIEKKY
jgi:hypothetical protein